MAKDGASLREVGRVDDGGPALQAGFAPFNSGMTLRDWYAGQALQGLLASGHFTTEDAGDGPWVWLERDEDEETGHKFTRIRVVEAADMIARRMLADRK